MCPGKKKPSSQPRGGRSQKEINILRRGGAWNGGNNEYLPAWLAAYRVAGPRGWLRHVFLDLEGHAPGCRWVAFWTAVTGRA